MLPDESFAPPRARYWPLLTAAFVGLVVCTFVGSIVAPSLAKSNPELLLALSSRIRHLLFAVPAGISPTRFAVIGFCRLLVAAIICFMLGRAVGDRLFVWFDGQSGGQRPLTLRWAERAVKTAAIPLVLIFPGSNIVCFLAGRRQMSLRRFVPIVAIGILLRLAWVWAAAKQFESQLSTALDFIDANQKWFMIGLIGLTVGPNMVKTYRTEKLRQSTAQQPQLDPSGQRHHPDADSSERPDPVGAD